MTFQLHPTIAKETKFIAMNTVTNKFWDGKGFLSPMIETAKALTEIEAIVVRNTFENVSVTDFQLEIAI